MGPPRTASSLFRLRTILSSLRHVHYRPAPGPALHCDSVLWTRADLGSVSSARVCVSLLLLLLLLCCVTVSCPRTDRPACLPLTDCRPARCSALRCGCGPTSVLLRCFLRSLRWLRWASHGVHQPTAARPTSRADLFATALRSGPSLGDRVLGCARLFTPRQGPRYRRPVAICMTTLGRSSDLLVRTLG